MVDMLHDAKPRGPFKGWFKWVFILVMSMALIYYFFLPLLGGL